MKVTDSEFVKGYIRMANDGYLHGWHERNGGNFSYRIKEWEAEEIKSNFTDNDNWKPIGATVKDLALEYFLITGTGKYFRNIILAPEKNIAIIQIDEKGENYKIVWGLTEGGEPTSEISSHLMNHQVKKQITNGEYRVIYHAHPVNIIALTFVLPLDSKVFTREIWEMETECPIVFPDGIGVVPWMVPGGPEIAVVTSELMKKHDAVVWAHHGIFCAGQDFDITYGLMDTIEKSAEILTKVLAIRPDKLNTITTENFKDVAKAYNVNIPDEYLS